MKRRIICAALLVFMLLFSAAVASAATVTIDGVQFELTTDKASYTAGETVRAVLNVKNEGNAKVDVTYDIVAPGNMTVSPQGGKLSVGAGESRSSASALKISAKSAAAAYSDLPDTGDHSSLGLMTALFVAAAAGLCVLCFKNKRFMTMMLVCMLLVGMSEPAFISIARADDAEEVYEEDAYQQDYLDEPSEESMDKAWGEEEAKLLGGIKGNDMTQEFAVEQSVTVDGQKMTITAIGTFTVKEDANSKATLGTVSLNPITILGKTSFRLTWNSVPGATHYEVWHSSGSGYVKKVTTPNLTWTTNYGKAGVINTYKVRAIVMSGGTVTARGAYATRTCYGMAAPVMQSVGHVSSTTENVRVRWKQGSFCTGYYVYRSLTGTTGSYSLIGNTTALSYIDKYRNGYYKIRPYYKAKNGITYVGPASGLKAMAPQYRALIIGQTYAGTSISKLPGCGNDAKDMKAMLATMSGPKYRAKDVKMQLNLTARGIDDQIKVAFARAKANDVSLFYYSGHGMYFGNSDSRTGALLGKDNVYITPSTLKSLLDRIPGKKIVIMDSCYSGNVIRSASREYGSDTLVVYKDDIKAGPEEVIPAMNQSIIDAFSNNGVTTKGALSASNYYVLTASAYYQESLELQWNTGKRFGLFTSGVLEASGYDSYTNSAAALKGDANRDRDLTLEEVYDYAYDYTYDLADYIGESQYPRRYPTNSSQVLWGR